MPSDTTFLKGLPPRDVELWKAQAEYNADNVSVVCEKPTLSKAATSSAWSQKVGFRLVGGSSGLTIPYTGKVAASAGDTSVAGTASVLSATPDVVMGRGYATLQGDAQAWLAAETATLTITYTDLRGSTKTATMVVTFV